MSEESASEAAEYGLVYPFVICQSKGGPYEDKAFVAGFQCGEIAATLAAVARSLPPQVRSGQIALTWTVQTGLEAQLDLVAMHHGFRISARVLYQAEPEWVALTFVNTGKE